MGRASSPNTSAPPPPKREEGERKKRKEGKEERGKKGEKETKEVASTLLIAASRSIRNMTHAKCHSHFHPKRKFLDETLTSIFLFKSAKVNGCIHGVGFDEP